MMQANGHPLLGRVVPLLLVLCLSAGGVARAEPLTLNLPSAPIPIQGQPQQFKFTLQAASPPSGSERPALVIELLVPPRALSQELRAVQLGPKETYRRLDGVVRGIAVQGGAGGQWTVWLGRSGRPESMKLHVRNDVNDKRAPLTNTQDYGALGSLGELSVSLPLAAPETLQEEPQLVSFEVNVRYAGSEKEFEASKSERISFNLQTQAKPGQPATPLKMPVVTLKMAWSGGASSKTIKLGDEVEIQYRIERAVRGRILGPMEGGNSLLQLPEPDKDGILSDSFKVRALGHADYMLEAEVRPEGATSSVQVFRSVSVDVRSLDEYANIALVPATVLPGGQVNVHWAAWGLSENDALTLVWTDHRGYRQVESLNVLSAQGQLCFIPPNVQEANDVSVRIGVGTSAVEKRLEVRRWQTPGGGAWTGDGSRPATGSSTWLSGVTGKPTGLAVSKDALVLSTREGLWWMGLDGAWVNPFAPLHKVALTGQGAESLKEWLGVVASKDKFVGLVRGETDKGAFKTTSGKLALIRFSSQRGTFEGVNLPDRFGSFDFFQLLELKGRIYVIGSSDDRTTGSPRRVIGAAVSINLDSAEEGRDRGVPEPLLSDQFLRGDWSMVTVDDAIYALSRNDDPAFPQDRGTLLAFRALDARSQITGTLSFPKLAGRREFEGGATRGLPVREDGISLLVKGVPVNVGGVLVLFGVGEGNRLNALPGAQGGLSCQLADIAQDLAYNPQTNAWSSCGNGLNADRDTLIAYLGGTRPRLWAVRSNTDSAAGGTNAFTLAVDSPQLFAADFLEGNPAAYVNYFGKSKVITIRNELREELVLGWAATAMVDISVVGPGAPDSRKVPAGGSATLTVRYREIDKFTLTLLGDKGGAAKPTTPLMVVGFAGSKGWLPPGGSGAKPNFIVEHEGSDLITVKPK